MTIANIKKNELLADYCTYRIGGPARMMFLARSEEEIIAGLKIAHENKERVFVLGGGSNILFSDAGFDGLILKMENRGIKIIEKKNEGARLDVGAGTSLAALVNFARDNDLTGMEWAAGIPGMAGGAIRGNAGAFGHEIGESVEKVRALEVSPEKIISKNFGKDDCEFVYRGSIFKQNKNLLIVGAQIILRKGDRAAIISAMEERLAKKRAAQPLEYPSAGSVFVNLPGFFAGKIIEDCGLKGKIAGGAQISEKHANFIINRGNAKAADVLDLIAQIKTAAKEKFNVDLREEIEIVKS